MPEIPPTPCPRCKRVNDAAEILPGLPPPGPGTLAVCWSCTALLILGDDLRPRLLTDGEIDGLPDDDANQLMTLVAAIRRERAERN